MKIGLKLLVTTAIVILLALLGVYSANAYYRFEGMKAEKQAMEYFRTGAFEKAVAEFSTVIKHQPENHHLYVRRGNAHVGLQQFDHAVRDYSTAIDAVSTGKVSEKPDQVAGLYFLRSQVYTVQQEYARAIADLEKAVSIQPGNTRMLNNLACMLATTPDAALRNGRRAVELATKACTETKWGEPNFLDTLASAYAESGDFTRAVKYQQQATASASNAEMVNDFKSRLRLYKSGKPYHATQGMIGQGK